MRIVRYTYVVYVYTTVLDLKRFERKRSRRWEIDLREVKRPLLKGHVVRSQVTRAALVVLIVNILLDTP